MEAGILPFNQLIDDEGEFLAPHLPILPMAIITITTFVNNIVYTSRILKFWDSILLEM